MENVWCLLKLKMDFLNNLTIYQDKIKIEYFFKCSRAIVSM
jgi:hypothetical protein